MPNKCQATLYHVADRCNREPDYNGKICKRCAETVKNVMQNTCALYGIALD